MLRNPLYAGWINSNGWGILTPGQFGPLIDTELFTKVEERFLGDNRARPRRSDSEEFPLRVFVRCAHCGKGLTGSFSKGRSRRYPYYTCRQPGCRAVKFKRDELQQEFIRFLYLLTPQNRFIRPFRAAVIETWEKKWEGQGQVHAVAEKRRSELEDRKQRLIDALLYDRIDKPTYDSQMAQVGTDLEALEKLVGDPVIEKKELSHLLDFADWMLARVAGIWNSANLENRKRIQGAIFPDGLCVSQDGFGTAQLPLFFNQFKPIPVDESDLASPGGFEPPLPP
jgi:hypothetical protein